MAYVDQDAVQHFFDCVEEYKQAAYEHFGLRQISDDMLSEVEERLVEAAQPVLWRETVPDRFTQNKGFITELRKGGMQFDSGYFGPVILVENRADPDHPLRVSVSRPDPDAGYQE
ncbi:hypothetical protein [Paraburkholderia aromaticivorans]|uniref:hypothetical protein n=1 Tax=Paraburkholderia aromaticivorans TaxID=2026199 RepID=UPI0038B7A841